jgi:maleate cis-trans isomerase
VLATDHTIEHESRRILADVPGVGLPQSRILNDARITPETPAAMEDRLAGGGPEHDAASMMLH